MHRHFAVIEQRQDPRQFSLHGPQSFLNLPTVKVCAVVLKKQFVIHQAVTIRLPGFVAISPRWHGSQSEGGTEGTLTVAKETRGRPTSARPSERSMIEAAATTIAPALVSLSIASRGDPPVVITPSTTRIRSPSLTRKPRRNVLTPFSRSVQMKRTLRRRATSYPMINPPIAGDATVSMPCERN